MGADLALIAKLLSVAHSTAAPDNMDAGIFEDIVFEAVGGWKVTIFYDGGELDYIDHFISPEGERFDIWADKLDPRIDNAVDGHSSNTLQCWRGLGDTARLLAILNCQEQS